MVWISVLHQQLVWSEGVPIQKIEKLRSPYGLPHILHISYFTIQEALYIANWLVWLDTQIHDTEAYES